MKFMPLCRLFHILSFFLRFFRYSQMNEETKKRDSWTAETGELIRQNSDQRVNIYAAATDSQITVYQMLPREIEKESFTFYDEQVQERLAAALEELKAAREYTLEEPLAVWNPFGTGSNGLYLYFDYDGAAGVSYTIHVADSGIEDYTAQANTSGDGAMEFLMVGLVPGQVNEVTLQVLDSSKNALDSFSFQITAPDPVSGYATLLESTDGTSQEALMDGGDMICCVSSDQIGRINALGQVTRIYELDGYVMHHDFTWGRDNSLLVLAPRENAADDAVMDRILEVNMETGEVTELLNLQDIFPEYYAQTDTVSETDPFFWQAGTRDWIHVNTIDTLEDDSIILSSRETSTIIKISDIYGEPSLSWLMGDSSYWEDTPYAGYCLEKSFDVPYSSIVSSVQLLEDNYVVNSGVAKTFCEYDPSGELIRSFVYDSSFQGYRVMKNDFSGYWFK